jgi:glycosyltransferase involved in cell wall biosynthesis
MLALTFVIIFIVNISWVISNLYLWSTEGITAVIGEETDVLLEDIYYSEYARWIIWVDLAWIMSLLIFIFRSKHYKTDPALHYLQFDDISNPKMCVAIPSYNEGETIGQVVTDYKNQKFVESVIVIDNDSSDNTVEIAKQHGATVIKKNQNKGFSHSFVLGLKESLKTDANIVVVTEADGTYSGGDLSKLLPYLENSDMVSGSRQTQILTEKGNQNSRFLVWGNIFLAKLIQLKHFSQDHLSVVNLTDVGCIFMIIKRDALLKIIDQLSEMDTEKSTWNISLRLYTTLLIIENDLRLIEVPVTFKKRIGKSKIGTGKNLGTIKMGLIFLWVILRY